MECEIYGECTFYIDKIELPDNFNCNLDCPYTKNKKGRDGERGGVVAND